MTRIFYTLATALIAAGAVFVPAAEACLACEYRPEVLDAPSNRAAPKAEPRQHNKAVSRERRSEPVQKRVVREERQPRREVVERPSKRSIEKRERVIVERSKPDKDIERTEPDQKPNQDVDTANQAVTERNIGIKKQVDTGPSNTAKVTEPSPNAPVETTAVSEKAIPETPATADDAAQPDEAKSDASVERTAGGDCKKYIPAARVTISVPCE